MSPPWTKSIRLVLVKDSWEISLISWYHFRSIFQQILENPVRVMTIAQCTMTLYNLCLFLLGSCLLLWFHVYTERLTLCLMLAWSSQQILQWIIPFAAWFIITGNGHIESNFRQTATTWEIFFTVPHLCTELSEDNNCFFKCSFENLFTLSQKTTHHRRRLKVLQEEAKVLSFARRARYVPIWSWLLILPLFTLLLETFGFSILLLAPQVHVCLLQFFPCLPRN